ncbi:MAG TPA: hypothetical protein VK009_05145 [Chloroflexota bacterium]|nr:hypothetical protein [Chloroflexota bacterium]
MNAIARKEQPTYLRLLRPNEIQQPEPYFRLELEDGPDGEELAVVTISRNARLLEGIRANESHLRDGCFAVRCEPPIITATNPKQDSLKRLYEAVCANPTASLRELASVLGTSRTTIMHMRRQLAVEGRLP